MKQDYVTFVLRLITFEENDVITASDGAFTEQGYDFGEYFGNEWGGNIG